MEKMAATQDVLSQYRHVVGTIRQKNYASNIHLSRRRDRQTLENSYCEAIYTALQEDNLRDTTFLKLKQLKAKIVRLYHETHHHLFLHNDEQNKRKMKNHPYTTY